MQEKKIEVYRGATGLSVEELSGQHIELVPDRIELRHMRRRRRHRHHDFDGGAVGGLVGINGVGSVSIEVGPRESRVREGPERYAPALLLALSYERRGRGVS